jgi:hypothetical protein
MIVFYHQLISVTVTQTVYICKININQPLMMDMEAASETWNTNSIIDTLTAQDFTVSVKAKNHM